ncbi:hypothetical protein EJB05_26975, partial [Eragrostis curvula]
MSTSDAVVDSSLHGTDAGLEDLELVTEETSADLNVLECANHQPQGKPRCTRDPYSYGLVRMVQPLVSFAMLNIESSIENRV